MLHSDKQYSNMPVAVKDGTRIVVQARMGSSRLPGKVMKNLNGKLLLYWVVQRASKAKVGPVIVATTDSESDDIIQSWCNEFGIECFRGPEQDVLKRFYDCAVEYGLQNVVRITSDCPLIDPFIIRDVVEKHVENHFDYTANCFEYTLPDGLDVEVVKTSALKAAHKKAVKNSDREHVTPYIRNNSSEFRIGYWQYSDPYNGRWTVDYRDDYEFVEKVYSFFKGNEIEFSHLDVKRLIDSDTVADTSDKHDANEGYGRSLVEDQEL